MRQRLWLVLILAIYVAVTAGYSILNPLFEAPDEFWHFFTAEFIADNGRLPAVETPPDEWLGQEAAQPPLYYGLGAAILAPLDTTGARDQIWLNPYAWIGNASALNNINRLVHSPAESWPWTGFTLGAHLLRLLSLLLGLGTLLAIYGSGRLIWPADTTKPLLATALVAFLPQFNFIHASITNDTLITLLASLALWQLIWLWQRWEPDSDAPQRWVVRFLLLGATVGLAALTKSAGILLLLYAFGFLVVLALRNGRPRLIVEAAVLVAGPAVLIAGWLWWRNYGLYSDITAANQFVAIAGGDRGYSLAQVLGESDGLLLSLVAVFGWFNLRPPSWVYWVWGSMVIVGLMGAFSCLIIRFRQRSSIKTAAISTTIVKYLQTGWALPLLLGGWVLLVEAGLIFFMLKTEAAQGRLLFPAILPLALGLAWGLTGSGRCRQRGLQAVTGRLAPLFALLALITTVYSLLFVVRPAYAVPDSVADLPDNTRLVLPELVDRGQGLSLLGVQAESHTAEPGDRVWLTFYWRADSPQDETPEFVLELFGRDMERIGNVHSYHGRGLYPVGLWPQGEIIADQVAVRIAEDAKTPVLGRVFARLAEGEPGIEVAEIRIVPNRWPTTSKTELAQFGDNITLRTVELAPQQVQGGDTVDIHVQWVVSEPPPGQAFTTLIHLGQPDQAPLATGDRPPLNGDYPTHVWQPGEVIEDVYEVTIPPGLASGRYPVWIGMYDSDSGVRLPVTVNGERQPNEVYLAGWVDVTGR